MQDDKKTFLVTLIGLDAPEENTLKRIFDVTLSLKRARSYQLIEMDNPKKPDIAIVNFAHPQAKYMLNVLNAKPGGHERDVPMVVADQTPSDHTYYLKRPWFAGRVLKLIDELTVREMDFIPEVKICENSSAELCPTIVSARQESSLTETDNDQSLNVLVVDDSLTVRKQVEMELLHHGIKADLVESGEKALDAVKNKKYDAVFLDVVMPGINGYDVCKRIRNNRENRKTPVIMLTSKSSSFDKVKGKFAGCSSYITKPVARNEFQQIIKQYLSVTETC